MVLVFQVLLGKDEIAVRQFQAPPKVELSCFTIFFLPLQSICYVPILH